MPVNLPLIDRQSQACHFGTAPGMIGLELRCQRAQIGQGTIRVGLAPGWHHLCAPWSSLSEGVVAGDSKSPLPE